MSTFIRACLSALTVHFTIAGIGGQARVVANEEDDGVRFAGGGEERFRRLGVREAGIREKQKVQRARYEQENYP